MIEAKKIIYLLCLVLAMGLVVVHLRTQHVQTINTLTSCTEQEHQIRQRLWHQQLRLSGVLESPVQIKERIEQLHVSVLPPGAAPEGLEVAGEVAQH